MRDKAFRGECGEVVAGFLSPATAFTAVPAGLSVIILTALAGFFAGKLELPMVVTVPVMLTLVAPITGLFAMAGRAGKTDAGFFEALAGHGGQGALGFTLRYGVLQAAWSVPLVLAFEKLQGTFLSMLMEGPGSKLVMATWIGVGLVAACVALPAMTLLVATRTDTVGETFSPGAWKWLLSERRADLMVFMASAVGAMLTFTLLAMAPLVMLLPMAVGISPSLGQGLMLALPLLPAATAPILLGRLAGAFVSAEMLPEPMVSSRSAPRLPVDGDVPAGSRTIAALAGIPRGQVSAMKLDCPTSVQPMRGGAQGVPLGVAIARAHQQADTDVAGALEELESLRSTNPRNAAIVAEIARVLKKAERHDEAREAAGNAIRLALSCGAGPIAHDVFKSFAHEAAQLNLEPAVYEQLGRILTARREYDGAAWCYRAAAALGGDPKSLQKGMLSVAETATSSGAHDRAAMVYEAFLKTWPDSPLAPFAKDGAETSLRKAQAVGPAR